MSQKKKKRLTSAIMAFMMSVSTTLSPVNMMASEVDTQIEERTAEMTGEASVFGQTETKAAVETIGNSEEIPETSQAQTSAIDTEAIETTAEVAYEEEETSLPTEIDPSGNSTEESSANETRGPDENEEVTTEAKNENETEVEVETEAETEEETTESETAGEFDLASASKEEVLAYIESLGGNDTDAFYDFLDSLDEDSYDLVWIAQYGNEEDVLSSEYGFDYDSASDLDAAKWTRSLEDDEFYDVLYSMTFEQYRRYLSIRDMMEEIEEKDFSDVIDEEEFTPDRSWDYESYDAFAQALTGVSLQRTEQTMQFYNTYVDPSQVQAGVTTIDGLLDSNTDWYSEDYLLSLNPQMFKETVPVYYGADGNYYVISSVPTLNGIETADYQPATSFYNGSIEAQAFTDITYLGNGVYQIPESRYRYCFMEQYVSDLGILYGITFGLRIQVLYGYTPSGTLTLATDVLYPDMTERLLPATLDLTAGTATVKVFNDEYDDTLDQYLVSASINRGASLPSSMGTLNDGKTVQFVVDDASAVGSLDVLIGYNVTSKYSMAAQVTTEELYSTAAYDADINLASELYNGSYLKVAKSSVPSNLAVGDKFVYKNIGLTIVGVNTCYDLSNTSANPDRGIHIGASTIPTHDAQSFCFYNGKGVDSQVSSWFKTQLNTNSADPGSMVQMTTANISARAAYNGTSTNLRVSPNPTDATERAHIFGYLSNGLTTASCSTDASKVLNLEGTNVLLSCMHAWGNESATTPQDIVDSISTFTERTQKDYAIDTGYGHYNPNIALQCTAISDGGDGYTYATFKVVTSMLEVRGVTYPQNYQCAFSTLRIAYENPKTGYLQIHKSSADPTITNGNSCYSFDAIDYGVFTDVACVNNIAILNLDENGYSKPLELTAGTYYVREAYETPGSGYKTNGTVYTVEVKEGSTASAPVMCNTTDEPLNDPLGINIVKINSDGTTTADLSGAEYTITYYPKQYTTLAEIEADPELKAGKITPTVWVIKTIKASNGNYRAALDDKYIVSGSAVYGKNNYGAYIIPLGTITVQETKAPVGFTTDGAAVSSAKTGAALTGTNGVYLFNIVDENSGVYLKCGNALSTEINDEDAITLTYAEVQNKAGISIQKYDSMTKGSASGNADLSGIRFAIINNTGASIVNYAGYTIANGAVAQVITTDANGYAATGKADLPVGVGNYTIKELRADASFDGKNFSEGSSTMANEYYQWKDNQITVTITDGNAGTVVNAGTVYDNPVRGDLSFVKKNSETEETLAYIPFKITNNNTGEVHYILTDANGTFNSATGKTTNTNANDAVLAQYGEKDIIPQSVIDSLTKDAGLWFGTADANDSYGALAYGNYTIVELKTEATKNMRMYTNTFTINAAGQALDFGTVNNVPMSIRTTLVDVNGEHFTEAAATVTLVDHVAYKNLDTDKTYTLTGTLYAKDGDALIELTTETVDFQPTETTSTQDVTFTFDASALVGKSVVAFEELSLNGEFCAEHKDKNDENQTVVFPGLKTTARDSQTDDHVSNADDSIAIIDTVEYSGLQVGNEYTITGTLMDQKTGKAVLDDNGNEITASKVITATESDGSVEIEFQFAGVSLAGKTIVVFENLDYEGKRYAVHADLNDESQTIYFPSIKTKAVDKNTGLNQVKEDSNVTVVDTVTYTGLQPGKTYTMTGMLMSSAGNAILSNGKRITASTEFVPTQSDGSVDVVFDFDASNGLGGRQYVFFEYLYLDGVRVAAHTDISDTNQIIYVPSIRTTLIDSENGSHSSAADQDITLIDTVRYNGVEIGRTYTVTGTLVDKATGKEIIDDAGKEITASAEFTAEKTNGTIDVTFVFSGVSLAGKTVVAFEHMYTEGKEVAVHADLRDEGQTEYFPSVHTTATASDTQDHVTKANEKVTITDQVALKALKIGVEYTVSGTLMDAETAKPILVNGNTITARRTFTADAHEMTIPLTYTLDASELAGTTTVVFENLYSDGALLASHADVTDAEQTVYIPEIHTTAKDAVTDINHTEAKNEATIVDTVFYTDLLPGREYTVSGTLVNKATGAPIMIGDEVVCASTTFTPSASTGSVDVLFTFDASAIEGKTVVAFESMTYKGIEIAVHADIVDEDQTVYIPKVRTTAISGDTKDHVTEAKKDVTIVDTVSYEGLEVGREYTLEGVLMNKATGKAITVDGKNVTAEATFTAETARGSIDLTFTFDGSELEDTLLVAFETLYTQGKEVGVHADINDGAQTVYLPKIRTNAKDAITEINHTEAKPQATIIDTVSYSSLLPGKEYVLHGTLMNKTTGEPVLIDGEPITAETTFTAEKSSGSVQVVFKFDASVLEGITVVAYETMTYKGIEVAVHADITDEDQTVYIPKIRTTAIGADTKDHVTEAKKDVTIVDTVSYEGLEVGREYTVTGILMDKRTQEAITVDGNAVTAETTFTAEAAEGTVDVIFTFDGSALEDTLLVAFEKLYTEEKEVGVHADINDDAQTVYLPKIRTNAKDAITEINHTEAKPQAKVIDTVTYSTLLPGKEYTVTGTLMNQTTGELVLIDGEPITASTTFTAERSSGSVQVVFEFDASVLEGITVVAYESMTYKGIEVAVHADITDEDQTDYIPKVRTTAISGDTKDHVTEAKKDVTIIDTVSYEGLEVGRAYTVKGVLMDKATGEAIKVNGKEVTAEATFTAEASKGTVDVVFTFDASELEDTLLVVFETLYTEEKEVGVHADINDAAQTVYIPKIRTEAKDAITQINHTEAKPQATIIDIVSYSSLLPGKEYVLHGTLMNKATGEPVLIDGELITAETTFVAEKSSGNVAVVFEFDASVLEGITVVAYESMTYKGIEVAVHADITDEDQTVYIPKIRTTAIGADTKDHVTAAKKDVTIVDTVSYEGLEVGREYTVTGILMDKETQEAILADGKEVTAETTFTAEAAEGSVDVIFTFDGSELEDTLLVAFETLYTEEKEVGVHADINDGAQTVYLPKIRTNAKDAITEINHTEAKPQATIIDTVSYSSLLPGKEYVLHGTLMNKTTGEPVMIGDEPVCASTTFIAETAEGSIEVVFEFDASAIAGTTVVAFESMEYEGVEVAVHADIEDEDQTVYIPDVHTTATASDTQDHVTGANEAVTITDEVALTGLKIGNEYTVKGVLMDKTTGEELTVNGESIVAETVFTADEADMTVTLEYILNASELAGTTTVVFETLYTEGKEVGRHHEIEDEGQTIYIPEIHTTAADKETEINHTEVTKKAVIVDTVLYSHLLAGKEYTVKGQLINKATGEPILIDGEPITAQTTFTAEKEEGSVDVIFEFDASAIAPTTIVAFEHLEYKEIEIAVHADIEDEDQTVYVPDIHTTALAQDTGDHIEKAKEDVTIVDTVAYEGLEIGREYTVKGILMDKESGEAILVDGEEVTAEETFTAEAQEGSIDITFTFDASALAGKSVVAFETLYTEEKEVAVHADIEDEGQTVHIPEVHTTATDKVTGDHDGVIAEETTVLDEVFYKNLIPGKEYTVKGTLMVKETGEPLTVDGKEITAEKTFTAEEADGSIILEFTFSSLALAGKHVVAFEDIEYQGISIATHADLEDEDQTISYPEIHTNAADQTSGSKTMTLGTTVTLVDTVTYTGLTAGKTYVVKGTVMDKVSGQPIGVTAETTFTAEETDGSVDVLFTLNTENLQGKTLVVFEELYDTEGNLIVSHSDPTDEDQTVTVPVKPVIPPVVTGDDSTPVPYVLALLAALLAAGIIVGVMARKRKKQA